MSLRPNLSTNGRLIRAGGAVTLGIAAALVWPHVRSVGIALAGSAAFVAFEAARGWCALRACGVKTKF